MALRVRVQDGVLLADPDLLKTLLYNLIDNARKASEPGSEILLHGAIRDNRYIFSVADRGRGIPKEEIHKITQAFYMVDKSRAQGPERRRPRPCAVRKDRPAPRRQAGAFNPSWARAPWSGW